jgi:hypothetical protein
VGNESAYEGGLWRALKRAHGAPLPQAVRAFLSAQHALALVEQVPRELVVKDMLGTLANLKAHNLWPPDDERPVKLGKLQSGAKRDGRWPLWRELRDRRAELIDERYDEPSWTALRVGRHREAGTITLAFDDRLADKTVNDALKHELPALRAQGWLRTAHPLGAFELAVVRYVCLESRLEASWRQRTKGWRHSRFCEAHPKWGKPYRGKHAARRFKKDFHRAEARLAGSKGGLGLYYDPRVRERRLKLRQKYVEAEPALTGAASSQHRVIAPRRVDPSKAEALRARFAAGAEIEALVVRAQAGDAAAADEAVALCRRWRPAAIDEICARLGRVHSRDPDDSDQLD